MVRRKLVIVAAAWLIGLLVSADADARGRGAHAGFRASHTRGFVAARPGGSHWGRQHRLDRRDAGLRHHRDMHRHARRDGDRHRREARIGMTPTSTAIVGTARPASATVIEAPAGGTPMANGTLRRASVCGGMAPAGGTPMASGTLRRASACGGMAPSGRENGVPKAAHARAWPMLSHAKEDIVCRYRHIEPSLRAWSPP